MPTHPSVSTSTASIPIVRVFYRPSVSIKSYALQNVIPYYQSSTPGVWRQSTLPVSSSTASFNPRYINRIQASSYSGALSIIQPYYTYTPTINPTSISASLTQLEEQAIANSGSYASVSPVYLYRNSSLSISAASKNIINGRKLYIPLISPNSKSLLNIGIEYIYRLISKSISSSISIITKRTLYHTHSVINSGAIITITPEPNNPELRPGPESNSNSLVNLVVRYLLRNSLLINSTTYSSVNSEIFSRIPFSASSYSHGDANRESLYNPGVSTTSKSISNILYSPLYREVISSQSSSIILLINSEFLYAATLSTESLSSSLISLGTSYYRPNIYIYVGSSSGIITSLSSGIERPVPESISNSILSLVVRYLIKISNTRSESTSASEVIYNHVYRPIIFPESISQFFANNESFYIPSVNISTNSIVNELNEFLYRSNPRIGSISNSNSIFSGATGHRPFPGALSSSISYVIARYLTRVNPIAGSQSSSSFNIESIHRLIPLISSISNSSISKEELYRPTPIILGKSQILINPEYLIRQMDVNIFSESSSYENAEIGNWISMLAEALSSSGASINVEYIKTGSGGEVAPVIYISLSNTPIQIVVQ